MSGRYRSHPVFARIYPRISLSLERKGGAELRDRLLAGLSGRVIEVGAGDGMNFTHYPPEVTSVLAVEPEPRLREIARQRAAKAPVPVEVADGVADGLPAVAASFDAAVLCFVLCTVPDQQQALAEARRVLRPGAELRFLEHVAAQTPGLLTAQRLLGRPWMALFGGCQLSRDTAAEIQAAGFTIGHLDRFRFPETAISMPTSPHILGMASR